MNQYIQMRLAQDNSDSLRVVQIEDHAIQDNIDSEQTLQNPFAEIHPVVFTNPFRVGDR